MSRGPGETQRYVLDELEGTAGWSHIRQLASRRYGSEPTPAQLESLRRAVRTLEKRGLVETQRNLKLGLPGMPLEVRLRKGARHA
jgi:CO/xanthine dehydrogenase Mo-binding subunit